MANERFSMLKHYKRVECSEVTVLARIAARECPKCGEQCDRIYTLKAPHVSDDALEVAVKVAFVHCRAVLSVTHVATEPAQRTWAKMRRTR